MKKSRKISKLKEKKADIKNVKMDKALGQAWFRTDAEDGNKRRYFLERRWGKGSKVLGVILMHPSDADAAILDQSTNKVGLFAVNSDDYDAMYAINLSPIFVKDSKSLIKMDEEHFDDTDYKDQKKAFKTVFNSADDIVLAWGEVGQRLFDKKIKDDKDFSKLFKQHLKEKQFLISDANDSENNHRFPYHPASHGDMSFINGNDFVKEWLE